MLLTLALAAACSGPDDGDAGATRTMVLETCAPGGDAVETEVCECAYDELADRYDADELERLDRQVRDDPENVPPELQEIVLDCGFEQVAPPTTKPATTSTSTSTSTSRSTSTTEQEP